MLDEICENLFEQKPNMMIPYYLMASYAYYQESDPIFTDTYFDQLAKRMLNNWDTLEHMHKYLITKSDLIAGSYLGKYPSMVKGGLGSLISTYAKTFENYKKQTNKRSTLDNFMN